MLSPHEDLLPKFKDPLTWSFPKVYKAEDAYNDDVSHVPKAHTTVDGPILHQRMWSQAVAFSFVKQFLYKRVNEDWDSSLSYSALLLEFSLLLSIFSEGKKWTEDIEEIFLSSEFPFCFFL